LGRKKEAPVEIPVQVRQALEAKLRELPSPPENACRYQSPADVARFCGRALLKGSQYCFWHTPSTEKYKAELMQEHFGDTRTLKEAVEREVAGGGSLAGAYLREAAIGGNWFVRGANLAGADLRFANLSHAHLSYGSLKGANLACADLESTYLSDVDMREANFTHASLFDVKFRNSNFSGVRGITKQSFQGWRWGFLPQYRILEEYPQDSKDTYRSLVGYFSSCGAIDDASWAAYRARVADREYLKKRVSLMSNVAELLVDNLFLRRETNPKRLVLKAYVQQVFNVLALARSYAYCYIFGYGEKPLRVAAFSILMIVSYALLFTWLHVLPERGFQTALYFSVVTFTTLGYGDLIPAKQFRLLAASEALVGLLLVGLFLFTLSRRAVGRG
jgi:hypothetical protein